LKNIYGGVYEIKEEYALELCELAKEWSMDELNFACQEFLKTGITHNNFREVAKKAEEMKSSGLAEAVSDFGAEHFVDLDLKVLPYSLGMKTIAKIQRNMRATKNKSLKY